MEIGTSSAQIKELCCLSTLISPSAPRPRPAWTPWLPSGMRSPWEFLYNLPVLLLLAPSGALVFNLVYYRFFISLHFYSNPNLISAFSGKVALRAKSSWSISSTRAWKKNFEKAAMDSRSPQPLCWSSHWWPPRSVRGQRQGPVRGRCTWSMVCGKLLLRFEKMNESLNCLKKTAFV